MRPAAGRLHYGVLAALLAVGTVIRVVQFLYRPSLSVDEAMLALSIGSRSYGGLLRRLDYGQTAPVLFLWATRFVTRLGGVNEFTLRALPLAAGLAFPVVVWRLAGRLLDGSRVAPGGPTARWPGGAVVRGPRRVLAGLGAFQHHRETVRERRPRGGRPHRVRARDHGDARLGDAMALATRGRGRRARTLGAGDFHVGRDRRVARARAFRAGHQRRSLVVDDRGRRVGCGICCFLLR